MPIRYGPIAAWLARATAHHLLLQRYAPESTTNWLYADISPIIDVGLPANRIRRFSDQDHFEMNGGQRKGTTRPIVLDYVHSRQFGGDFDLEGIGLTEHAVDWLIENRWVPAIYRPMLENNDGQDEIAADPHFRHWLDNIYIAPPETCLVQKPSTDQRTKHDNARTYTQAERIVALAEIAARTDIDVRAKAAHKAHVTRRTVEAAS